MAETTSNGSPALEYWLKTGNYLWEGFEYSEAPNELEVDVARGVLYVHSLIIGDTRLRMCSIPDDVFTLSGIMSLGPRDMFFHLDVDLATTPAGRGMSDNPLYKKGATVIYRRKPVFFALPGFIEPSGISSFSVVNEAGAPYLDVHGVPEYITKQLWLGKFADITVGHTGGRRN